MIVIVQQLTKNKNIFTPANKNLQKIIWLSGLEAECVLNTKVNNDTKAVVLQRNETDKLDSNPARIAQLAAYQLEEQKVHSLNPTLVSFKFL